MRYSTDTHLSKSSVAQTLIFYVSTSCVSVCVYVYIYQYVYWFIVSVCVLASLCLCVCVYICVTVHLHIYVSLICVSNVSVCLYVYLSICLYVCMSVCLCVIPYPCISIPKCLCIKCVCVSSYMCVWHIPRHMGCTVPRVCLCVGPAVCRPAWLACTQDSFIQACVELHSEELHTAHNLIMQHIMGVQVILLPSLPITPSSPGVVCLCMCTRPPLARSWMSENTFCEWMVKGGGAYLLL